MVETKNLIDTLRIVSEEIKERAHPIHASTVDLAATRLAELLSLLRECRDEGARWRKTADALDAEPQAEWTAVSADTIKRLVALAARIDAAIGSEKE